MVKALFFLISNSRSVGEYIHNSALCRCDSPNRLTESICPSTNTCICLFEDMADQCVTFALAWPHSKFQNFFTANTAPLPPWEPYQRRFPKELADTLFEEASWTVAVSTTVMLSLFRYSIADVDAWVLPRWPSRLPDRVPIPPPPSWPRPRKPRRSRDRVLFDQALLGLQSLPGVRQGPRNSPTKMPATAGRALRQCTGLW